jgi:hypothetical protein
MTTSVETEVLAHHRPGDARIGTMNPSHLGQCKPQSSTQSKQTMRLALVAVGVVVVEVLECRVNSVGIPMQVMSTGFKLSLGAAQRRVSIICPIPHQRQILILKCCWNTLAYGLAADQSQRDP